MPNRQATVLSSAQQTVVTADDVQRILGGLDALTLVEVMAMRPSIADLEQASAWLGGQWHLFSPTRPLRPVAGQIVNLLTVERVGILKVADGRA